MVSFTILGVSLISLDCADLHFSFRDVRGGIWIQWNGMVDWNSGMEWWTGTVEWNGRLEWWNGIMDWNGGMEWWTGIVEWNHPYFC